MPTFDFDNVFQVLTEHRPFRWQRRLFDEWLSQGKLPSAIDIPTGLGKTAVMAVWLLARAAGADLPRRLVYVVDRRAVVDQATRFAEKLRANMPSKLATRLGIKNSVAGGLPISTLRGGFSDNRDWLEDPVRPAIVVGTIDMIGSRLLFEGYGVSRRMRPYHAGFLGVDTLLLLDEAHLCPPFEALLRSLADHRDDKFGSKPGNGLVTPPFCLVPLSATGRNSVETHRASPFGLDKQDRKESAVRQRLTAKKRLKVTTLKDPQLLVERMANRAIKLGAGDKPSRVVVYCNSRKDAVEVKQLIDKECKQRQKGKKMDAKWESELLVGERRVYERVGLEDWLERNGFLADSKILLQTPTFLVATSAGEVGVDLDADHAVCDLVACERMVQRLGRVNRLGGKGRVATVDVFATCPPEPKENAKKAQKEAYEKNLEIYKQRMAPLRKLLHEEDGRRDASPSAMVALKQDHPDVVRAATTPAPLYPELTRPLVDAWSMTSLTQHEGRPEIAPWLRGWEEDDDPQTEVVWRKYLPCEHRGRDDAADISVRSIVATKFFRAAPIHATEKLEALSSRVFDWLLKRAVQAGKSNKSGKKGEAPEPLVKGEEIALILIDQSGECQQHMSFSALQRLAAPAKKMSATEKQNWKKWKERLLPGALLVVDARIGGLQDGMLDEKGESEVPTADADEDWRRKKEEQSAESPPIIKFRVETVETDEKGEGLKKPAIKIGDWRHIQTFETHFKTEGVAQRGMAVHTWSNSASDENARSILSMPQTLADHAREAADRAHDLATRLGLPDEDVDALTMAARLHDNGKAAPRWQEAMNAPKKDRPYAKTSGGGNWRLLEGYRHEFGSLLQVEKADLPKNIRDLILHLIAAHHGGARPFISSAGCKDGPPSLLESRAGEAALRFARLQKQYGPWGLAWREAILRAADQGVSREWSDRHRKDT